MQDRYRLRFTTGDREGEEVRLVGPTITLGRRPGNTIQVADASVSGRHAELTIDERGAALTDLGSTNGTRVGDQPVTPAQRLAHGDEIVLGSVHLVFQDAELSEFPAAPSPAPDPSPGASAESAELAGTGVRSISADALKRSGRRPVALVGIALVLAAAAAAFWFLRGDEGARFAERPVVPVEGNLLGASYSFEGDPEDDSAPVDVGWSSAEDAPADFLPARSAAASGATGLAAALAAEEWALHRSEAVSVTAGRGLEIAAPVAVDGDANVRLGLSFESSTGAARSLVTWSPATRAGEDGVRELAHASAVPQGYDRARALVLAALSSAGDSGTVGIDDVSLVAAAGGEPASCGEYRLATLGDGDVLSLFKIDRVLCGDIRAAAGDAPLEERARLSVEAQATGFRVTVSQAPAGARLRLEVSPEAGLATLGAGGFARHRTEIDVEGVSSCLFGQGVHLVALDLDAPGRVRGRPVEGAYRIEVDLAGASGFVLQTAFAAERAEAAELARDARSAERDGLLGPALATWQRLLDTYPHEEALAREATEARARLVQQGLAEIAEVRGLVERAEFFALPDLYRQCRDRIEVIAERYAGTEVEVEARADVDRLEGDLAVIFVDLDEAEVGRLQEIERMLDAAEMPRLAERVRGYLTERYGVTPGSATPEAAVGDGATPEGSTP